MRPRLERVATRVRQATAADAAAIARIHNQGIADRVATFETDERSAADVERALAERGSRYPTIVVEHEGAVLAWAAASLYRSRACYAGIGEFSGYVAREARGRGVGRIAMEALISASERSGLWSWSHGSSRKTPRAWLCAARSDSARSAPTGGTRGSRASGRTW